MTIRQAIYCLKTQSYIWIRPVHWKGTGMGLVTHDEDNSNSTLDRVPSPRGGDPYIPTVQDLCDQWETKDPSDILTENRGKCK